MTASSEMTNGHGADDMNGSIPQPRLLLDVVSSRAKDDPFATWASVPRSSTDLRQGYEDVTFIRLHHAVNRAARWLDDTLAPKKLCQFEPLAYIGPPDTRYIILALAAIKAGYQMLFLSPRNSDEAQYSVLDQAECSTFLCATSMRDRIKHLLDNRPRRSTDGATKTSIHLVPEQSGLLEESPAPEYPYSKTVDEARTEPLVILHTSSTTGLPKTIPLNQGYGFHEDVIQHVPKIDGLDVIERKPFYGPCRMFVAMPLFHAGGVLLCLLKALYHDIVIVFPPSAVPLSAGVVAEILRFGECDGCVLPPSLLEDMLPVPSYLDVLASLKFVQFGSGPLSKATGDALLKRQTNCPHYIGSSEAGLLPLLELDDPVGDWQFFNFHPWSGVDMRPVGKDDDLHELFIVRTKPIVGLQPVFELFPDLEEWRTRELYARHPAKPHLWRCVGRADDVLVLSNGEKLNPSDTEARITNSLPPITGALVVGEGKFMPGLLLETKGVDTNDPEEREKLLRALEPIIERANIEAPKHGQLTKSLIMFTSPDKPFLRTPKLSVRRQPTIQMYTIAINEMFDRYEEEGGSDIDIPKGMNLQSVESTGRLLEHLITKVTGWKQPPKPIDDLFTLGMDSLHVIRIVKALRMVLSRQDAASKPEVITAKLVYDNPTIEALSDALLRLTSESGEQQRNGTGSMNGHGSAEFSREEKLEKVIANHSKFSYETNRAGESNGASSRISVIITGSTGSLGTYLLSSLLSHPSVTQIYCLNRAKDAVSRQLENLKSQGLLQNSASMDPRVKFFCTTDLSTPTLGLDESDYRELQDSATHILHNAWPVNFNLSLPSFNSHIAGVRQLAQFSAGSKHLARLIFVSSLSSCTALAARSKNPVPEEVNFDASAPSPMGYGESKYCAERVLEAATAASRPSKPESRGFGVNNTILRVGQIAGPVSAPEGKGTWNIREWFPSILKSSTSIDALPDTLGRMESVDWVPVDKLAQIICELAGLAGEEQNDETTSQTSVYHLINPVAISWQQDLLPIVKARLNITRTVSLAEWIAKVKDGPAETHNPAKKILGFYEGLVLSKGEQGVDVKRRKYQVDQSMRQSPTLRGMSAVGVEWMELWLQQLNLH